MGTFGHIYLKLKEEDKGKTISFDINKIPKAVTRENDIRMPSLKVHIPKKAKYIYIYHHFDSRPIDLGKTLSEKYKDYDTILNLLLAGDMSTINDHVISQRNFNNEYLPPKFVTKSSKVDKWDRAKNKWKKELMLDSEGNLVSKNALLGYYAYIFDGEKWYVTFDKKFGEYDYEHVDWTDVDLEIDKQELEKEIV